MWHTFATWNELAFDASGWHPITDLVAANEAFEGRRLELVGIDLDLAEFCAAHRHRMPQDYWADPVPRAEAYLDRFVPPWQA